MKAVYNVTHITNEASTMRSLNENSNEHRHFLLVLFYPWTFPLADVKNRTNHTKCLLFCTITVFLIRNRQKNPQPRLYHIDVKGQKCTTQRMFGETLNAAWIIQVCSFVCPVRFVWQSFSLNLLLLLFYFMSFTRDFRLWNIINGAWQKCIEMSIDSTVSMCSNSTYRTRRFRSHSLFFICRLFGFARMLHSASVCVCRSCDTSMLYAVCCVHTIYL